MPKLCSFNTWFLAACVWTGLVGYFAWTTWPQLPLDSGTDPATLEMLRAAALSHGLRFGLLAAVPPAIALVFGTIMCRKRTGGD